MKLKHIGIIILIIIILIIGLNLYKKVNRKAGPDRAKSLLQSLNVSAGIYCKEQKKHPKTFADFVAISGEPEGPQKLTLHYYLKSIIDIQGYNSRKMTVGYPENRSSTYYLNGCSITAEFKGW